MLTRSQSRNLARLERARTSALRALYAAAPGPLLDCLAHAPPEARRAFGEADAALCYAESDLILSGRGYRSKFGVFIPC